ncbi:MAG: class I SAM-dependent methyltransferase [Armatimonadetes bacterium]|nr:class I SAM-dependent methyltransferase [Armatimonadota bacterium]
MAVDLYDELGGGYDVIINWERRLARETPFYRDLFARHQVARLLDVGCGTGWHARLFAGWGIAVVAADPSRAMLDVAGEVTRGLPVQLVEAGFAELPGLCETPFQAVVCLGNTLPHATTPRARAAALAAFRQCLAPGGVCVIQTLNYDLLRATGERFQPLSHGVVDGREQILLRMFDFGAVTWQFNILRFTRRDTGWEFTVSSAQHLPVFSADLAAQLQAAGFHGVRLLGGFDGNQFDPGASDMLLAVGQG